MSTAGIVGEEIGKQVALASIAAKSISGPVADFRNALPHAVLAMLGPNSASKFLAERILQSDTFDAELVKGLYDKLLPLGRMVDDVLSAARREGYFDDPEAAEPLRWLETCNEQVKDAWWRWSPCWTPNLTTLWLRRWRSTSAARLSR